NHLPMILVGHVTKDGGIAGPMILEHMVDTVLYFEGERHYPYRVLRTVKNRYGSTFEIGVFEMGGEGLTEVLNPSLAFLSDRPVSAPGSAVAACMEGSRPLLAEIQALVSHSSLAQPRRVVTGVDYNRVNMLLAVLEKRTGLKLSDKDAYVNIAGGIRLQEPAMDLAIAAALASSFRNKALKDKAAVMGELGLAGEIRPVVYPEKRAQEAEKLGMQILFAPKGTKAKATNSHIEIREAATLVEMLDLVFS
ncbi:MAG: DNA repair protein RadA, partial [Clostridiales bacterium]|nr:DNA repair protein RadA [Clostridiales bacterium]